MAIEHRSQAAPSENANKLIQEKPSNWEFKLLQTALDDQVQKLNDQWQEAKTGYTAELAFSDWVNAQFAELKGLLSPIKQLLTSDLQEALGAPGQPGDANKLLQVVDGLADVISHAIAWEESVSMFALDPRFSEVASAMSGMSKPYLDVVNELHRKLSEQIPNLDKTGSIDLSFTMRPLPNVDAFGDALDNLARRVEERVGRER